MDDRFNYTKADWLMWTAALGNEDQVGVRNMVRINNCVIVVCDVNFNPLQFSTITDMVYKFVDETDGRYPFPDWYVILWIWDTA